MRCKKGIWKSFLLLFLLFSLLGCKYRGGEREMDRREGKMEYAENLFIDEREGYTVATIRNPWDTLRTLATYILVDRSSPLPENLPKGEVLRVPLENLLVYSAIHTGLLSELGGASKISGVCNAQYVTDSLIKKRIERGVIIDCGDDMNPDVERIIKLHPEAILLSPFESGDRYAKISRLGIPMIQCADYMEHSALGQAEWMKFYGLLIGKKAEAEERFDYISRRYSELRDKAAMEKSRPRILLDQIYGQSWSVPGGESTMGRLIEDAGGENPFAGFRQSGGVYLSPEKVLKDADSANIWLLRYNQDNEKTLRELSRDAGVNSQFKAFKTGNVYGCNTRYVPFFDETPFRPDLLLEEMVKIFHPGILEGDTTLRYFKKLEK